MVRAPTEAMDAQKRKANERRSGVNARLVKMIGAVSIAFCGGGALADAAIQYGVDTRFKENATIYDSATPGLAGYGLLGPSAELGLSVDGVFALDTAKFYAAADAQLAVHTGTVVVAGSPSAAQLFPQPSETLAKAALWVDANVNVILEEDGVNVKEWLDVREAAEAAPADRRYVRAVADHDHASATNSPVRQTIEGDKPSLYFGGRQSGVSCKFAGPSSDAIYAMTGIQHVFFAHAVYNAYGYVVGGAKNTPHSFGLLNANGSPDQPVTGMNATDCTELYHSRVYVDGELVDPQHTNVTKGRISVHEYEFLSPARASAFYNERYLNGTINRTGGDNLCEAVIFTNRLTAAERLAVSAYLRDKWTGRRASAINLSLAKGAAARFEGSENSPVFPDGAGTLAVAANGTLALTNVAARPFDGDVALSPGATVHAGLFAPCRLEPGTALTVSDNVMSVAESVPGVIAKAGDGPAVLNGVDARARVLAVNAGTLSLTPAVLNADVEAGFVRDATISDASFETSVTPNNGFDRVDAGYGRNFATGVKIYNVTRYDDTLASYAGIYVPEINQSSVGNSVPAPDGTNVVFLACASSVSLPVAFHVPGRYVLSFWGTGRNVNRQGQQHAVRIAQGGATQEVATVTTWNGPYVHYRYVTPRVDAGAAELLLEGVAEPVNAGSLFDDFKLAYYDAGADAGIVPVPNGDFEGTVAWPINSAGTTSGQTRSAPSFSTNNVPVGWTFTQGDDFETTGKPQVGISTADMGGSGNRKSMYFNKGENRHGTTQLTLFRRGGTATTDPFRVPAGRYRLRADIGWFTYTLENDTPVNTQRHEIQIVEASVNVGGREAVSLGNFTTESKLLTPTTLDTAFDVGENEDVVVRLETTVESGCMLMDNLVLVPVGKRRRDETILGQPHPVVLDGTGWEADANAAEGGDKSGYQSPAYSVNPAANYWGVEICPGRTPGQRFAVISQRAAVRHEVAFTAPGRYRLSYWAASRHDMTGQQDRGNNPLEAWLVDANGVTNRLGWTRVDHNHFMEYTFLFDVPAAGTYTLGIQGMNPGTAATNNRSVRVDRVSIRAVETADDTPDIPEDLEISVGSGALLRLDYPGTNKIGRLRIAGRSFAGLISLATHPELASSLSGPGTLEVTAKGTMVIFR